MTSKTDLLLLLVVLLFTATLILFVSPEVEAAREITETSNTVDKSVKSKGEVNDAKYPDDDDGGPSPWWWGEYPGDGYGDYPDGGGGGRGGEGGGGGSRRPDCRFDTCIRGGYPGGGGGEYPQGNRGGGGGGGRKPDAAVKP